MLTVEEALERIVRTAPAVRVERVDLAAAAARVLAERIVAPLDLPPFAASAMDGFAVRAADTPGTLAVVETVAAGSVARGRVEPGTAIRIMTGAPVPAGADAVVMVEDTTTDADRVSVGVAARVGQHVRPAGNDVTAGTVLLEPGATLHAGALGMIASLGIASVAVARRPRVAVISTGDEIVEPGRPLGPGQIHSSNSRALCALVEEAGGVAVDLGNVPDDPAAIRRAFDAGAVHDLVLSTGGVSVGDFDHVKAVLGDAVEAWRVRMKPGKPLVVARLGSTPVLGLPGNPVSCMVNFLQFARPGSARRSAIPGRTSR